MCQSAENNSINRLAQRYQARPSDCSGGPNHDRHGLAAKAVTTHCHTSHATHRLNKILRRGSATSSQRRKMPSASQSATTVLQINIPSTIGSSFQWPARKVGSPSHAMLKNSKESNPPEAANNRGACRVRRIMRLCLQLGCRVRNKKPRWLQRGYSDRGQSSIF